MTEEQIRTRIACAAQLLRFAQKELNELADFTDNTELLNGISYVENKLHAAGTVAEELSRRESQDVLLRRQLEESLELVNQKPRKASLGQRIENLRMFKS